MSKTLRAGLSCASPEPPPLQPQNFSWWLLLTAQCSVISSFENLSSSGEAPPLQPPSDWLTDQPTVNSARLHLLLPRPLPFSSFPFDFSVWDLRVLYSLGWWIFSIRILTFWVEMVQIRTILWSPCAHVQSQSFLLRTRFDDQDECHLWVMFTNINIALAKLIFFYQSVHVVIDNKLHNSFDMFWRFVISQSVPGPEQYI